MAWKLASCQPLKISQASGDITLSTFDTSVGSIVQFLCAGDQDVLHGSPVLQCTTTGSWNGTVPRCIHKDELANFTTTGSDVITSTFDPMSATTPSVEQAGYQIETVVVLLWAVGGAMLVTLAILLVCILRSHKKARRERSARTSSRGNPRHGGVNPSFTAYDEIWTWIPVVRDSQDQCPVQINPSARENSSIAERNLLSTLRLPSYNEAVRNNQNRQQSNTSQGIPRPSVSMETRDNGRDRSTYPQTTVTSVNDNHYDTIPADVTPQPNTRTSSNVTRVSVTASSGTSRMTNHPSVHQSALCVSQSRDIRSSIQSPGIPHYSRHGDRQRSAESESRHNIPSQSSTTNTLQVRHISRPLSQPGYPQFQREENGDTSEFIHSERSAFAHYRERTRRVNDATHTVGREDISGMVCSGDPAVSLTRLPRVQTYGLVPSAPTARVCGIWVSKSLDPDQAPSYSVFDLDPSFMQK